MVVQWTEQVRPSQTFVLPDFVLVCKAVENVRDTRLHPDYVFEDQLLLLLDWTLRHLLLQVQHVIARSTEANLLADRVFQLLEVLDRLHVAHPMGTF